jgi:hypothetical protein
LRSVRSPQAVLNRRSPDRPRSRSPSAQAAANPSADRPAFLFWLPHKDAALTGGTEIDFDAFDPVALEAKELGIAKALSTLGHAPIGYEGLVALDKYLLDILLFDPAGVPATLEIGRLVERVVIRAGEAKNRR